MRSTINMIKMVTRVPSITCLKVLLFSLGKESSTNPHVLYVADDEFVSFRSLMGVIDNSEQI